MNEQYEALIAAVDDLLQHFNASCIAIDGMSGAGKTTLAAALSRQYGAPVIHLDAFRLPNGAHGADAVDFDRFREEIVEPWMQKKPLVYTECDPKTGEPQRRAALPDARLYIVEGTYALHPAIPDIYDLRIFMKLPEAQQAERIAKMKPSPASEDIVLENEYFLLYMTEMFADLVLDENLVLPDGNGQGNE